MSEYAAKVSEIDEDGGQTVFITMDGEPFSLQYLYDYRQTSQWVAQELGILRAMDAAGDTLCEHGLSAGLCSGPQHY